MQGTPLKRVTVLLPAPIKRSTHAGCSVLFYDGDLNLKKANAVKKTIDNRF